MSQWGNNDQPNNSPVWAPAWFGLAPNTANRDNLFNNASPDAFVKHQTVGVFGVSRSELSGSGKIGGVVVTAAGSGFDAVPSVDVDNTGTGGNGAAFTVELGLVGATVNAAGSGYALGDAVTVSANATVNATLSVSGVSTILSQNAVSFNGSGANGTFVAGSNYAVGDEITLNDGSVINVTAESSNAVTGFDIVGKSANAAAITQNNPTLTQQSTTGAGTGFTLTLGNNNQEVAALEISHKGAWQADPAGNTGLPAAGGSGSSLTVDVDFGVGKVNVTNAGSGYVSAPALTINGTGQNVALEVKISTVTGRVTHAGWVLKREGTGGRAGRVTFETLVAGDLSGDADSDVIPE